VSITFTVTWWRVSSLSTYENTIKKNTEVLWYQSLEIYAFMWGTNNNWCCSTLLAVLNCEWFLTDAAYCPLSICAAHILLSLSIKLSKCSTVWSKVVVRIEFYECTYDMLIKRAWLALMQLVNANSLKLYNTANELNIGSQKQNTEKQRWQIMVQEQCSFHQQIRHVVY